MKYRMNIDGSIQFHIFIPRFDLKLIMQRSQLIAKSIT